MTDVVKDPAEQLRLAAKDLDEAEFSLGHGRTRSAVVFAYYAAFHAAEARIANENRSAKSHRSVNLLIGEIYKGDGLRPQSTLSQLETRREAVNYGKTVEPDLDEAADSVAKAKAFVARMEQDVGPLQTSTDVDIATLQALRDLGRGRGGGR